MNMNLKKIILIALYVAIFVVLSLYGTINAFNVKLTLQNLPVYIAAITLGTAPGAIVGFAGMMINQMLTYGFTATTLFWVLPQTIVGAVCGYLFEYSKVRVDGGIKFWVCILFMQLLLTFLNTVVYCIDALIFSYFNFLTIFAPIVFRIMCSVLTGILYCIIIPPLVRITKKIH